jgi:hypothetical protein
VLSESGVSVTCYVNACGAKWWLTSENGELPRPCADEECVSCAWSGTVCIPRVAYLVVVMQAPLERAEFCLAPLCLRSVQSLLRGVLVAWRKERSGVQFGYNMACVLGGGGWSSVHRRCYCSVREGPCCWCKDIPVEERVWIARNGFTGVSPSADRPWFTGVTRACDISAVRNRVGWKWLSCNGEEF